MEEKEEFLNDKDDLKKYVTNSFNRVNHDVLSLVQVLCKNDYQYSQVRAQVLRITNNTLRDIVAEVDVHNVERVSDRRKQVDYYEVEE